VADSKILNLLVVEDDLEDEQLLCEALAEIEETRQWCGWRGAGVIQVDHLADALDCLNRQRFDAVLLNLTLPDNPAVLDTFLQIHAAAQDAPIVVLADEEDESLAHRLLREGAEDVVLKTTLDCALLARSIRYAIERRRRSAASQIYAHSAGILDRHAFALIACHLVQLASSRQLDLNLAILEISDIPAATPDDREARELLLMRAADLLQDAIPAPAVIGRVDKCRFALILPAPGEDPIARAAREIEDVLRRLVAASVSFSMMPLNGIENIEGLLNRTQPTESLVEAKTVMLAD